MLDNSAASTSDNFSLGTDAKRVRSVKLVNQLAVLCSRSRFYLSKSTKVISTLRLLRVLCCQLYDIKTERVRQTELPVPSSTKHQAYE